jgi:hypothetical protein
MPFPPCPRRGPVPFVRALRTLAGAERGGEAAWDECAWHGACRCSRAGDGSRTGTVAWEGEGSCDVRWPLKIVVLSV